nr:MAG TPA: hypothetical protein [Caudoviricetes sp.]
MIFYMFGIDREIDYFCTIPNRNDILYRDDCRFLFWEFQQVIIYQFAPI